MLGPYDCRVGRKVRWGGESRENRDDAAAIVEVGEDEGWTRTEAWSWVVKFWKYFGVGDTGPAQYEGCNAVTEAGVIWGTAGNSQTRSEVEPGLLAGSRRPYSKRYRFSKETH